MIVMRSMKVLRLIQSFIIVLFIYSTMFSSELSAWSTLSLWSQLDLLF